MLGGPEDFSKLEEAAIELIVGPLSGDEDGALLTIKARATSFLPPSNILRAQLWRASRFRRAFMSSVCTVALAGESSAAAGACEFPPALGCSRLRLRYLL